MENKKPELSLDRLSVIISIALGVVQIMQAIREDAGMLYIVGVPTVIALLVWVFYKVIRVKTLPTFLRFALLPLAVLVLFLVAKYLNTGEKTGQIFLENVQVSLYAGNGADDVNEETSVGLLDARFSGVGSLSVSDDTLYLADYGKLCVLENGTAILSDAQGGYSVQIVHCHDDSVYFLTDISPDSGETSGDSPLYLSFVRIRDGEVSLLYQYETAIFDGRLMASFSDFAVASNGDIWFLEQNYALDYTILNRLPYDSATDSYGLQEAYFPVQEFDIQQTAQSRMAFDEADNLYISLPEKGQILRVDRKTIRSQEPGGNYTVFAGRERTGDSMLKPIDGAAPTFCYPTSLAYLDGYLYVMDFDMVRRIAIRDGQASHCVTFAGKHSEDKRDVGIARGSGNEVEFVAENDEFLAVGEDERVFLSDPKHRVVYLIRQMW